MREPLVEQPILLYCCNHLSGIKDVSSFVVVETPASVLIKRCPYLLLLLLRLQLVYLLRGVLIKRCLHYLLCVLYYLYCVITVNVSRW